MADADPYLTLGIAAGASDDEIRTAFRRAVRDRHPDTSSTSTDDAAVRDIIDAYRLLMDPAERSRYDASRPSPYVEECGQHAIRVRNNSTAEAPSLRGVRPCPQCRGIGLLPDVTTCPACIGRAEITTIEPTRARVLRCPTCRGSGKIRRHRLCEMCGGRGTVAAQL